MSKCKKRRSGIGRRTYGIDLVCRGRAMARSKMQAVPLTLHLSQLLKICSPLQGKKKGGGYWNHLSHSGNALLLSALGMHRTFDLRHVSQDRRRWPVLLLGSTSTPPRVNGEPAAFSIGTRRQPRIRNAIRLLSRRTCATLLPRLCRLLLDVV